MEQREPKAAPSEEYMAKIIGVRFRNGGKLYNFDPGNLDLKVGDLVIVQTENGLVCGTVAGGQQQVSLDYLKKPLKKVLREVTEEDLQALRENRALEQKARRFCYERVQARKMQMKLVEVEYLFDRSKAIFYFTADGRVDFRELVKDLASRLRTRIEMRQIGVRDEAKMIGGFGACGKEFCCKTFVREFEPVSIKMAKQQNLTLNPSKISGVCGRLMCCLSYESANYSCFRKGLPKQGKTIKTPDGSARVLSHNVLKGSITVKTQDGRAVEIFEPDLSRLRKGLPLAESLESEKPTERQKDAKPDRPPRSEAARAARKEAPKPQTIKQRREQDKPKEPEGPKESLLSRLKKMTGVDKEQADAGKKRRRRRRRRGRSRGKKPGTASGQSDKEKK